MTTNSCASPITIGAAGQDAETRRAIAELLRKNGYLVSEMGDLGMLAASAPVEQTAESARAGFEDYLNSVMPRAAEGCGIVAVISIAVQHEPFQGSVSGPSDGQTFTFENALCGEITKVAREFLLTLGDSNAIKETRVARVERARFALAVAFITKTAQALELANKLQERFATPVAVGGRELRILASVGVVTYPSIGTVSAQGLVERAEIASFCVSHQSDRAPQLYTEAMARWTSQRRQLERSLQQAIANNELMVYYQPRIATHGRKISGMEALARWKHPTLGMVPPAQFIPIAEETGLIIQIGDWVLRRACQQCKAWLDAGLPPVRMGVNVSATQFRNPKWSETVLNILRETGLPSDHLELELTESILMEDPKGAIQTLQKLKKAGIHLSIDDFGTGYSSLSYLKRFPVDALKIDQSFIRQVTSNPEDAAITTAIIVLGHSLNLTVIAEGVETKSQLEFLEILNCDEIQGFLFGRPTAAEQAEAVLRQQIAVAG